MMINSVLEELRVRRFADSYLQEEIENLTAYDIVFM